MGSPSLLLFLFCLILFSSSFIKYVEVGLQSRAKASWVGGETVEYFKRRCVAKIWQSVSADGNECPDGILLNSNIGQAR